VEYLVGSVVQAASRACGSAQDFTLGRSLDPEFYDNLICNASLLAALFLLKKMGLWNAEKGLLLVLKPVDTTDYCQVR
jgi:hypothetical protein